MTGYRSNSKWSDLNELRCLQAFVILKENNNPRNLLTELATNISKESGLSVGSVKAKIGNYKSVAGVTGHSNASLNTKSMFKNFGHLSSAQLQKLINEKYL